MYSEIKSDKEENTSEIKQNFGSFLVYVDGYDLQMTLLQKMEKTLNNIYTIKQSATPRNQNFRQKGMMGKLHPLI